jgi:hypothetical protein
LAAKVFWKENSGDALYQMIQNMLIKGEHWSRLEQASHFIEKDFR